MLYLLGFLPSAPQVIASIHPCSIMSQSADPPLLKKLFSFTKVRNYQEIQP